MASSTLVIFILTIWIYTTGASPIASQANIETSSSDRSMKQNSITENLQKFKDLVLERFEQIRQGRGVNETRQANNSTGGESAEKPARTRNSKIMKFEETETTTPKPTTTTTTEGPKDEVEVINNTENPNTEEAGEVGGAGVAEEAGEAEEDETELKNHRNQKNLNYFPYYQRPYYNLDYNNNYYNYYNPHKEFSSFNNLNIPDEWLARTEPFKRKNTQQLIDSPIYYIRLPPSPYVYVPGIGYVSRPPTLNEPEVLNNLPDSAVHDNKPKDNSNFIHVPIDFVSNGKPTSVYQLPTDSNKPLAPKPDISLDKGPYLFNGRPIDIYILRNSYNSLYADALTNFYP